MIPMTNRSSFYECDRFSDGAEVDESARGRAHARPLAKKLDRGLQGSSSAAAATTSTSPCRFTRRKVIPQGGLVILIKRVA